MSVALPTEETVGHEYDFAGRLERVVLPDGAVTYGYYPADATCTGCSAGKLESIAGPDDVSVSFAYDGPLPTTTTWSGAVTGSVSRQYDTFFRPISETITTASGTSTVAVGYDNDGLITCVSPTTCITLGTDTLSLTRGGTTTSTIRHDGQITAVSVSPMTGTRTYNTYGELARQQDISGSTLYDLILDESTAPRDALGRITRKTETVRGVTTVERYAYDAQGRLSDVYEGNTLAEHYTYDANGNRLSLATPSETLAATYDAQDRLLSYGPWSFEYTANGDLARKTNTLTGEATDYNYDALGNLKTVVLPGGDVVEYLWDGAGRRVGKVRNGVLVQQLLYRDGLNPVAELDGSGNLVSHFLYGEKPNVPSLMRRGSTTYRVFSDQVGSPVLVVNVSNATDVLFEASYSAFGEQTVTVGNADALPFGFAGGRWDAETGLVRFGARDYDPTTGRWVSKDPIRWDGGQANLYVYVGNDPVNLLDPLGLRRWSSEEVEEILQDYRNQIDTLSFVDKYWLMYRRHSSLGSDDFYYHLDGTFRADTFCVRGREIGSADFGNFLAGYGAGYSLDPVALDLTHLAGGVFGVYGAAIGEADWSFDQLVWMGDNTRSVIFIQAGAAVGAYDRVSR